MNEPAIGHLTLRQLRVVSAIYATRRISAAAERLNLTQSAASVLLAQAEAALGARLFDRTTRSVAPTRAVEQVIGIIDRVLGDIDAMGAAMSDLKGLEHGQIRIAATPATGMALLPATVRRFRAAHPRVALVLDDCAPDQFFSIIREEKADFGLGTVPVDSTDFDWTVLHDDPLVLVCPVDHPLAARPEVPWTALDGVPLIISRRDYGVRDLVERSLQAAGGRVVIANEIGFLYSAVWMASCGMGVCVFPQHLAQAVRDPGLTRRPLVGPRVTRPAAVVTRRGRSLSPAATRFVEMLAADLAADLAPAPGPARAAAAG